MCLMKQEVSAADGVVSLVIKNALLIEENEKGFQNIRSCSLFSFICGGGGVGGGTQLRKCHWVSGQPREAVGTRRSSYKEGDRGLVGGQT